MDMQKINEYYKKAQENQQKNPQEFLKWCKLLMKEVYKKGE